MSVLGSEPEIQVKFILDSTSWPQIIQLVQAFGQEIQDRVLYLTRTWAFAMHKHKLKLLGRWPEHLKAKRMTADDQPTPTIDSHPDYTNNSESNNVISNLDLISAMTPLPQGQSSTTLLPTSATPTPAGCVSPRPASTTLQASTTTVHYDKRLLVPDLLTTVQRDQPQDPMPGPSNFTTSNSLPSVNHVVGMIKNKTGRGKGHGVTDCSLSSVAGHQQSESATTSVSLYVTPIV